MPGQERRKALGCAEHPQQPLGSCRFRQHRPGLLRSGIQQPDQEPERLIRIRRNLEVLDDGARNRTERVLRGTELGETEPGELGERRRGAGQRISRLVCSSNGVTWAR